MTLGERIRELRKQHGLSQEQLAKESGLSTMSIRRYEAGERIPPDPVLQRIATALNVDVAKLHWRVRVGWGDEPTKEFPLDSEEDFKEQELRQETFYTFELLNLQGKTKARDYINDLYSMPKYKDTPDE